MKTSKQLLLDLHFCVALNNFTLNASK